MNDLGWPWRADTHSVPEKMRLSEPTTKIWMKIDPYYQQQKCRTLTLVSGDMCRCSQGFSGEGASNDSGIIENVDFHVHDLWTLRLRHLRKWGQHIIQHYLVLCRLSTDPKIYDLDDLDGLFGVKFCFRTGLAGWDRATENNCVKTNKDRHILSAVWIFGRDSSFWRYKVCADIRSGSLERRR